MHVNCACVHVRARRSEDSFLRVGSLLHKVSRSWGIEVKSSSLVAGPLPSKPSYRPLPFFSIVSLLVGAFSFEIVAHAVIIPRWHG